MVQLLSNMQGPSPDVRIKWPNDIYANKLKIGGILCQSVYRDGAFHVVIGAGLNVNNAKPTTCLSALIQGCKGQEVGTHKEISREVSIGHTCAHTDLSLSAHSERQNLKEWLFPQGAYPR